MYLVWGLFTKSINAHSQNASSPVYDHLKIVPMIGLYRSTDLLHGFQVAVLRVAVDATQRLDHALSSCKHAVRQQKCVKEVDAQESQVCQTVE